MRALGLTGPTDGSGGDQITIRLFNKKLDVRRLPKMVESRKAELLRRQNEPSRDLEEIEKEGDGENENEGEVEDVVTIYNRGGGIGGCRAGGRRPRFC